MTVDEFMRMTAAWPPLSTVDFLDILSTLVVNGQVPGVPSATEASGIDGGVVSYGDTVADALALMISQKLDTPEKITAFDAISREMIGEAA